MRAQSVIRSVSLVALSLALGGCAATAGSGTRSSTVPNVLTGSPAGVDSPAPSTPTGSSRPLVPAAMPAAAPVRQDAAQICAGNSAAQFVLVDVSEQHAWMCSHSTLVYNTAVTTGETANGDDTPTGTWHIQNKQGARYLTTLDGSRYHVQYWMPYDDIYGFHDAAWQTFPEGSPLYHAHGSHGCVHLPLAAMKWLYNWASVGATVTIRP